MLTELPASPYALVAMCPVGALVHLTIELSAFHYEWNHEYSQLLSEAMGFSCCLWASLLKRV